MADRRTSVAKDVELSPSAQAVLASYGRSSRSDFNLAREDDPSQSHENAGDQRGEGSQMVKEDQPRPENRPPEEIARPVDREAFNQRWQAEQERASQQQGDYDRADTYER